MTRNILFSWSILMLFLGNVQGQVKPELKVQVGHPSGVTDIAFLPNGKSFLSSDKHGSVNQWETNSGRVIRTFSGHSSGVNSILLLNQGKSFLTTSFDNTIKHWNMEDGSVIRSFIGHKKGVTSLTILPDNNTFLTTSVDKTIKYWDLKSGKLIKSFDGHKDWVTGAILIPGTSTFISESRDGTVKHWHLKTGKLIKTFSHEFNIRNIILLSKSKTFLGASDDGVIRQWHIKKGHITQTYKGHRQGQAQWMKGRETILKLLHISPKSDYFFSCGILGNIIMWSIKKGKEIRRMEGKHAGYITDLLYLKHKMTLISADSKGKVIQWDVLREKDLQTYLVYRNMERGRNRNKRIDKIVRSPDGNTFMCAGESSIIPKWHLETGKLIMTYKGKAAQTKNVQFIPNRNSFLAIHWTPSDGTSRVIDKFGSTLNEYEKTIKHWDLERIRVLSSSQDVYSMFVDVKIIILKNSNSFLYNSGDNVIYQKSLENGKVIRSFKQHLYDIEEIIVLPDSLSFISIDSSGSIKQLSIKDGNLIHSFEGHTKTVYDIKLLPDGKTFLSTGADNKIIHWNLNTGNIITQSEGHTSVSKLQLTSDSTFISFDSDCVKYWNLKTGKIIQTIKVPLLVSTGHLILLPNGKSFLYRIRNGTIIQTSLLTRKLMKFFVGHTESVNSIVLLNNGKYFLSGGNDGYINYWNIEEVNSIHTFKAQSPIRSIRLSPNGKTFFTISKNGTIQNWDIESRKNIGIFGNNFVPREIISFYDDSSKFMTINQYYSVSLWNIAKQEEICTLIPKAGNNKDFVMVTPDNYYFATKGAINDLVHYVVGTQVYLFNQFDLQYNRPDIVLERIGLAPKELIATYRLAYIKRLERMGFSQERIKFFVEGNFDKDFNAPEVELVDKQGFVYEETNNPNYKVKFKATDKKYHLERIHLNIDGVPVFGAKGIDILANKRKEIEKTLEATLHQGKNIITLYVVNEQGVASLEQRMEIVYTPPTEKRRKPNLYVLAVGVNQYQSPHITALEYAVKDAEKVAEIFGGNKAQFGKIKTITLLDEQVNRESVLALRKELLKTNPEDMVVFSFSGHGFLDDEQNYYLATYNTDLDKLAETGLKYDMVESLLDSIPARQKLMLIDACHSGEVDQASLRLKKGEKVEERVESRRRTKNDGSTYEVNVLSQNAFEVMKASFSDLRIGTGTTVISASGGLEVATEDNAWGHGAFTYALIQGLGQDKKADLDQDGVVKLSELKKYLSEEVERLTDGFQKPTSRIENIANDFIVRK